MIKKTLLLLPLTWASLPKETAAILVRDDPIGKAFTRDLTNSISFGQLYWPTLPDLSMMNVISRGAQPAKEQHKTQIVTEEFAHQFYFLSKRGIFPRKVTPWKDDSDGHNPENYSHDLFAI